METRNIINTFVLNGPLFYFSIAPLIGAKTTEEEGAGIQYKVLMALLLVVGLYYFLRGLYNRRVFTLKEVLPLSILVIYIIDGYIQGFETNVVYLMMICFSLPAVCIALNMKEYDTLVGMMKWLDLFLPLFSLSFLFQIYEIYLSKLEGGSFYSQSASYRIAFCFLVDVFLLRYGRLVSPFEFLKNKWYRIFKICLLPYFVVMAFFAGGRGAFVTMLVGLLFNIDLLTHNAKLMKRFVYVAIGVFLAIVVGLGMLDEDSEFKEFFVGNFNRITALVDFQNMDTGNATSGRDEIYSDALGFIADRPVYGYGLYAYLFKMEMFPHNIFLEILLQGGLLFLTVFCFMLVMSYGKYRKMLQFDKSQILLMPFAIYAFTELLFSSSYTYEPLFWFVLTYIYNFSFPEEQPIENG